MLIWTIWLINVQKTLSVVMCLPLDQVIHGLFPQQDQGDQQGLHHPGEKTVKSQWWIVATFFSAALQRIKLYLAVLLAACCLSTSVPRFMCRDSLMIRFYLFTFGPDMDRPGCPGMPSWPGIPRSPWKLRVDKRLKIQFMLVFILTKLLLPTTCRGLILMLIKSWVGVAYIFNSKVFIIE